MDVCKLFKPPQGHTRLPASRSTNFHLKKTTHATCPSRPEGEGGGDPLVVRTNVHVLCFLAAGNTSSHTKRHARRHETYVCLSMVDLTTHTHNYSLPSPLFSPFTLIIFSSPPLHTILLKSLAARYDTVIFPTFCVPFAPLNPLLRFLPSLAVSVAPSCLKCFVRLPVFQVTSPTYHGGIGSCVGERIRTENTPPPPPSHPSSLPPKDVQTWPS